MRFLRNTEIIEKEFVNIFENAKRNIVIISPYIEVYKKDKENEPKIWDKIYNLLQKKQEEGILIEVHTRENQDSRNPEIKITRDDVKNKFNEINLELKNIYLHMFLHAKLYFNEKTAIITSLNLTQCSINNKNIEIGYVTENEKEYNEIMSCFYFHKIIKDNSIIRERRMNIFKDYINTIQHDQKIGNEKIFNEDYKIIFNDDYKITIRITENEVEITDGNDEDMYWGNIYGIYYDIDNLNNIYHSDFKDEINNSNYRNIGVLDNYNNSITLMHRNGYTGPSIDDMFLNDYLFFEIKEDISQIVAILKKVIG